MDDYQLGSNDQMYNKELNKKEESFATHKRYSSYSTVDAQVA